VPWTPNDFIIARITFIAIIYTAMAVDADGRRPSTDEGDRDVPAKRAKMNDMRREQTDGRRH
jgi:hypothetical protein